MEKRIDALIALQEVQVLGGAVLRSSASAIHEVMFTVDTEFAVDPKFGGVRFEVVEVQVRPGEPERLRFVMEARVTPE